MRIKNTLILIFVLYVSTSCRNGVNITIENKCDFLLDSLFIQTDFNSKKIGRTEIDQSYKFFVNFKDAKHKGDGIFILNLFSQGKVRSQQFGYFSNGIPPSYDFDIKIYNDSIKIGTY